MCLTYPVPVFSSKCYGFMWFLCHVVFVYLLPFGALATQCTRDVSCSPASRILGPRGVLPLVSLHALLAVLPLLSYERHRPWWVSSLGLIRSRPPLFRSRIDCPRTRPAHNARNRAVLRLRPSGWGWGGFGCLCSGWTFTASGSDEVPSLVLRISLKLESDQWPRGMHIL